MTLTISFYGRSSSPFFLPSTTVVCTYVTATVLPFDLNTLYMMVDIALTHSVLADQSGYISFSKNQLSKPKIYSFLSWYGMFR